MLCLMLILTQSFCTQRSVSKTRKFSLSGGAGRKYLWYILQGADFPPLRAAKLPALPPENQRITHLQFETLQRFGIPPSRSHTGTWSAAWLREAMVLQRHSTSFAGHGDAGCVKLLTNPNQSIRLLILDLMELSLRYIIAT